jgi:CheY-like chemotaxis protein
MKNEPLHILLADDDEGDRLIFKEAFEELKLKTVVQTVNDGIALMKYLLDEAMPLPDILFLDLNMPRKNGLECLKEIKQDDRLKDISIAIYSTSASEMDMEATFLNGANIYINKPNDYNILKQSLEKAVSVAHLYREPDFNKENFLLKIE